MAFITTESGQIIQTESGQSLVTSIDYVQNNDIQQFDFAVDLLRAILWQYNEATNLQSILESKQDWYDENQQTFWQDWIRNVFDLRTANEFGCAVWSIILDLPLFVNTPPRSLDAPTFGFNNAYFKNFNRGNFGSRSGGSNDLPLETKRLALQLRYYQLVSSGTVPEVNRFLAYIFANKGKVLLKDNHDMTQTYIFLFPVTADLAYLIDNFDILARPAGVGSNWRDATRGAWGFGPYQLNFNRGNFAS